MSDMKRQECLSSHQSIDSAKLCVATEAATNGNVSSLSLQPPTKTCRVGISHWSVARAGTQHQSMDYHSQNGLMDTVDRHRLDSCLSEGEQVNVFAVDEVIRFCWLLFLLFFIRGGHWRVRLMMIMIRGALAIVTPMLFSLDPVWITQWTFIPEVGSLLNSDTYKVDFLTILCNLRLGTWYRVHKSHQPLNRLQYVFATLPLTLTF